MADVVTPLLVAIALLLLTYFIFQFVQQWMKRRRAPKEQHH